MSKLSKYRDIAEHRRSTWSSTNTFPFFFPFGNSTPTGVIIFNFGIPNSFSVYTRCFFLVGTADLVFCCLGGGPLGFFETLLFVFAPDALGLPEPLELLPFLERGLDLTVLVGAMDDRLLNVLQLLKSQILRLRAKIKRARSARDEEIPYRPRQYYPQVLGVMGS